jgi:CPA1 family monovalent cation:H+ antiporter
MPWAVAIALGAIVAPPDAAAATAILRQVNLPYRIQKILEGESLLNDASSLLIYRVAIGLVAAEHMKVREFVPSIAVALVGSLAAGFLLAQLWTMITRRITEAPSAIITQFAGTFMVWIIAERVGLSGILTIVAYAITIARTAPARTSARLRVTSYAVWETVTFVLNVFAFMLIGMQLRPIWSGLDDDVRFKYCSFAAAILAVVILARILWVMPYGGFLRGLKAHGLLPSDVAASVPTLRRGIVVSWCGMRGIVTLAAAFALPESFPYRDLILLTAFAVVFGTLVIQGLTLRPLILALNFDGDDPVAREAARARTIAYRAALGEIDADPSEEAEILRLEYRAVLLRAESDPDCGLTSRELPADPLRRRAVAAARQALLQLRRTEAIGDDAFHLVEEELDRAELSVEV